jgi:hypothetical protein
MESEMTNNKWVNPGCETRECWVRDMMDEIYSISGTVSTWGDPHIANWAADEMQRMVKEMWAILNEMPPKYHQKLSEFTRCVRLPRLPTVTQR